MTIKLEGRIAGAWVAELDRAWEEAMLRLGSKRLTLNLSDVTYADARGKQALRRIYAQARAELQTGSPWTQSLAEEVAANNDAERV